MTDVYIARNLFTYRGGTEIMIPEVELVTLGSPLIVLGDAGLGKTSLLVALAARLGAHRLSAGAFMREANLNALKPHPGLPILVDGLDELPAAAGASPVDTVLAKLSALGKPPFVLSCRAADWDGSAARHKIREDYGTEPVLVRLAPFSRADAAAVLAKRVGTDAEELLADLDHADLEEFYTNPLTLTLVAEIAADHQGLPTGRADLFNRAGRILVGESNPIHRRGAAGLANPDAVLDAAGAIFTHLLLSGSQGIADRPVDAVPAGFVAVGDLTGLAEAGLIAATIKSRLFRSEDENILVPYHRVIAEFLAGRWLASRPNAGVSERRMLQMLTFGGAVPTALRGLHAWFGHFAPRLRDMCIRADPYGALRYGDPAQLSLGQARLLLNALSALAEEDPYFRSEDWGRRGIAGLARAELKPEILALLKNPDRHVHLSTLVLEALPGSTLTAAIVPELTKLVGNSGGVYVERSNAAEALISAKIPVKWIAVIRKLHTSSRSADKRLALETMGQLPPDLIPAADIADALLGYHGVFLEERGEAHVGGSDYLLLNSLTPTRCAALLDAIAKRIVAFPRGPHWRMGHNMASAMQRLMNRAITGPPLAPKQLWSWLRLTVGDRGPFDEDRAKIGALLKADYVLRRKIQQLAFSDRGIDGAPWMAIVHELPQINPALSVSAEDAAVFLGEIARRERLSNFDIELWVSLLRINGGGPAGFSIDIALAAERGIVRHPELQRHWDELMAPPKHDWRKEDETRRTRLRREREQRFDVHRQGYAKRRKQISEGRDLGALNNFAHAYLNRYSDLSTEGGAVERLQEWLGDDLTRAAQEGFANVLQRKDLPSAQAVAATHAEGKTWTSEAVIICGIAERVRQGQPLDAVPLEVRKAALIAWWEFPDFNTQKLGEDIGQRLEADLFTSDATIAELLVTALEPKIKAGHESVTGLYRMAHDERFHGVAGPLALRWLDAYPGAKPSIQQELLQAALQFASSYAVRTTAQARAANLQKEDAALRPLWVAAQFLVDFAGNEGTLAAAWAHDRDHLWAVRSLVRTDRGKRWFALSARQLEFLVEHFAMRWPPVDHPSGGWSGDRNAWDAAEFMRAVIGSLGANPSEEASDALDRLAETANAAPYRDQIKHVRAQQRRLRRDTDYRVPSFASVKAALASGLPGSIDDLKAMILDGIEVTQAYLRQGDTTAWTAFWRGGVPQSENTCRDRLLDQLRGYLPHAIHANPEALMPDTKRADIAAFYNGMGLPLEIKGQWHKDVWNAPSSQLIDLYTKDYRAAARGVYVVLWFGDVPGKKLPLRPAGKPMPKTPTQLRAMLIEGLDPSERKRVEIVVLDVSPTKASKPAADDRKARRQTLPTKARRKALRR